MVIARAFGLLLGVVVPLVLGAWLLGRASRRRARAVDLAAIALGAIALVAAELGERALTRWTGVAGHGGPASDPAVLAYAFLVAAPLEQGLKLAAFVPLWRSRFVPDVRSAVVRAALVALGFACAHGALQLGTGVPSAAAVGRIWLAIPAHLFLASSWGYVLGRDPHKRLGGRAFDATWLGAALFNGLYDHIVFERSPAALLATPPILAVMALVALAGGRAVSERERRAATPRRRRFLPSIAPPSLEAMRVALRRAERPVTIGWILFGALVTVGVMTALLVGAVVLGHRIGVDFAAVDRGESSQAGTAPLILLGSAALCAFPLAGYLVARASATHSVLEPALSAALAILGSLVLLGLAAPISLVFAIAFAPVAFGLACGGAWIGVGR
jgi:RsiW-degrading membrane proteinase PrsW (M82 family)